MNKPKIICVLDAENEDDRNYASENLIGCFVGYANDYKRACEYDVYETFSILLDANPINNFYVRGVSWRYIVEFSNSRPKETIAEASEGESKYKDRMCESCHEVTPSFCQPCVNAIKDDYIELGKNKKPPFYCAANIDEVPDDAVGKEWEFSDAIAEPWVKAIYQGVGPYREYPFDGGDYYHYFMRPIQQKPVKRMKEIDMQLKFFELASDTEIVDAYLGNCKYDIDLITKTLSKIMNCKVVI